MFLKSCQRGKRNPNELQIRPPFQENLIDKEFTKQPQYHIHHFGNEIIELDTFVTKSDHDNFVSQEGENDQEPIEEEFGGRSSQKGSRRSNLI